MLRTDGLKIFPSSTNVGLGRTRRRGRGGGMKFWREERGEGKRQTENVTETETDNQTRHYKNLGIFKNRQFLIYLMKT